MSIKDKVALALEAIERLARSSERDGELGEVRGLRAAAMELRKFFRAGDLEPLPGPREILCVRFDQAEALSTAESWAKLGKTGVVVRHEKIRVETTWRWGWVVVADARKEGA